LQLSRLIFDSTDPSAAAQLTEVI